MMCRRDGTFANICYYYLVKSIIWWREQDDDHIPSMSMHSNSSWFIQWDFQSTLYAFSKEGVIQFVGAQEKVQYLTVTSDSKKDNEAIPGASVHSVISPFLHDTTWTRINTATCKTADISNIFNSTEFCHKQRRSVRPFYLAPIRSMEQLYCSFYPIRRNQQSTQSKQSRRIRFVLRWFNLSDRLFARYYK